MARTKEDALSLSDDELELLGFFVNEQIVIDHSSFRGDRYKLDDPLFSLVRLQNVGHPQIPEWPKVADHLQKKGLLALCNRETLQELIDARAKEIDKTSIPDIRALVHSPTGIGAYVSFHGPTAQAAILIAALRPRLEEIRHRQAMVRAQGPVVVTKKRERWDSAGYSPGAGRAYRVLRATGNRLYVSAVILDDANPDVFVDHAEHDRHDFYLKGTGPNQYLERDAILAENVTPAQYSRMLAETAEFEASLDMANHEMEGEIAPIRRRFEQRRAQLLAQLKEGIQRAHEGPPEVGAAVKANKVP